MTFESVPGYEDFALKLELENQHLLHEHCYNTIGNFVRFYDEYCASGRHVTLEDFYRKYEPPVADEHCTCVGLALRLVELVRGLEKQFPGVTNKLMLASCEEEIENVDDYCEESPPSKQCSEKEHVVLAIRLRIGTRRGYLLLDPGYHVSRVVTVMEDAMYPHTGWFSQSSTSKAKREYKYTVDESGDYVDWHIRETREGLAKEHHSLIYVARPFLRPVDVTERRNLVYGFKSWLKRDTKGHLLAGLYFSLKKGKDGEFCLFYQQDKVRFEGKVPFAYLLGGERRGGNGDGDGGGAVITNTRREEELIGEVGDRLTGDTIGFRIMLAKVAAIVTDDRDFTTQLHQIDEQIAGVSARN